MPKKMPYVTLQVAAKVMGISKASVAQWYDRGEIKGVLCEDARKRRVLMVLRASLPGDVRKTKCEYCNKTFIPKRVGRARFCCDVHRRMAFVEKLAAERKKKKRR